MSKYTKEESKKLIAYIALKNPGKQNRLGNKLYQDLVDNEEWARRHSWSGWRSHYQQNQENYDRNIAKYQDKHNIARPPSPSRGGSRPHAQQLNASRRAFDALEDKHLVAFLAQVAPQKGKMPKKFGRSGNYVYQVILADWEKYPWASTHPWQSWRDRYAKNKEHFDERIARWQKKHGMQSGASEYWNNLERDILRVKDESGGNEKYEIPGVHGVKRLRPEDDEDVDEETTDTVVPPPKKPKHTNADPSGPSHGNYADKHIDSSSHTGTATSPHNEAPNEEVRKDDTADSVEAILTGNGYDGKPSLSTQEDTTEDHARSTPRTHINVRRSLDIISSPSTGDAGFLNHDVPTPLSETSGRLPRHGPESLEPPAHSAVTEKTPRNVRTPTARSHTPTPPSVHSESSVPVLGEDFRMSMLSPVEIDKQRIELSSTAVEASPQPNGTHGYDILGASDPSSTSKHSVAESPWQYLNSSTIIHRSHLRSLSSSQLSDGPFATCSPSPPKIGVIHGLPKPREKSFRNNDRVRIRKVVGQRSGPRGDTQREDESSDEDQPNTVASRPLADGRSKIAELRSQMPSLLPEPSPAAPVSGKPAVGPKAPNDLLVSTKAALNSSDSSGVNIVAHLRPPAEVADVFTSAVPLPSDGKHRPYVLGTPNLRPELSKWPASRTQISTPIPSGPAQRSRNRRRTFAGFGLQSKLPDINLLAELKAKRTRSRSPAAWTRGSPEITILPSQEPQRPESSNFLSNVEHAMARRGHLRKSVIPVVANLAAGVTVPSSLQQLSSSTSGIIFREGLAAIFKSMENNHGFSAEIVRRTWLQQNMDVLATDKKLLRMRIAAEKAANSDEGEDGAQHPAIAKELTRAAPHGTPSADIARTTDYTPPVRSRAGHYRRSLEQGRYWEARQREIDLAGRISANASPSTATSSKPGVTVWGEKEDAALLASSEGALLRLARRFGEKVLREKALALMMVDD